MNDAPHIVLYSHDTFGLGHLRRSRKIAMTLVDRFCDAHATIITGSDLSSRFPAHDRIHFAPIPQIEKQPDGSYRPADRRLTYEQVIEARSHAIMEALKRRPADIFITDKEPLGLSGELMPALGYLKACGATLVLGLRDVLDDTALLRSEWERKGIYERIEGLYDHIWIYGTESFHHPLRDMGLPASVLSSCSFMGFLYRSLGQAGAPALPADLPEDYLLVTAGGGGDGDFVMNAVVDAYEQDAGIATPAVLLLGPYADPRQAHSIRARAQGTGRMHVIDFDSEPEGLIRRASAVVGMCGYNTFCEVVSRNKKALFVPRQTPRLEQYIRASRAAELGWCRMAPEAVASRPLDFAAAIRALIADKEPVGSGIDAHGLERIGDAVETILHDRSDHSVQLARAER